VVVGSTRWDDALSYFNIIFIAVFTAEAVCKLMAIGPRAYFHEKWNRFDFVVVALSLAGLGINAGVGANVVRVFRVARVFRLINKAKTLRALFNTLIVSLPSLWNIGSLLFVLFFIFAVLGALSLLLSPRCCCVCGRACVVVVVVLVDVCCDDACMWRCMSSGVSLFGTIPASEMPRHANFVNFLMAMLTLWRAASGDAWEEMMYSCREKTQIAPLYFFAFLVIGSMVMVNLFIAVILVRVGCVLICSLLLVCLSAPHVAVIARVLSRHCRRTSARAWRARAQ
jgi:hypothetical protein